jgi:NAD(P)-dependent dehydrogenase (short-subunit alcohol dehydrogenase family)
LVSSSRTARRVALVTGAGKGIGTAISDRFARDGHDVVAADIVTTARAPHELDVRDPEAWTRLVERIVRERGTIDILVNNAGVAGRTAPAWEVTPDEWRHVIDVDLSGVFYGCRAVLPEMRKRRYGRIVNIASIAGKEGNPNAAAYSAAKAGVIGLTKSVAKEVCTEGILVNAVTPAVIETDILKQVTDEFRQYMVSRIPMGRTGQVEEVAALVAWLASDECSFSTGAVFDISGGRATY